MSKLQYLLWVIITLTNALSYAKCPDELIQGKFLWSEKADKEFFDRTLTKKVYRSTPSCYNSSDYLVVRSCENDQWSLKAETIAKCFELNETKPINSKCPVSSTEFVTEENKYICLEISSTTEKYKKQNNIRNSLHSLSLKYLRSLNITSIWSSKTISDNFSVHFNLTSVQTKLLSFDEILKSETKKCFVENLESSSLNQIECDKEFYSVREYSPDKLSMKSGCPENTAAFILNPSSCVGVKPGTLTFDFEEFIENFNWIKDAWRYFFKGFNNLQLDTTNTTFVRPDKTYFMDFPSGIYLEERNSNNLYLNKLNLEEAKVSLDIKHNEVSGFLEVKCGNCNYLYKFYEDFEGFFCYTTDKEGNPKRVKIEKISDKKWSIRYDQEKEGYRFYWCEGFSIFNFDLVSSPKIKTGWLSENSEVVEFEFTVGMTRTKTSKAVLETMNNDSLLSDVEIIKVTSIDYSIIKLLISKVINNASIEEFQNHTLQNYNFVDNFVTLKTNHFNLGPLKGILHNIDNNTFEESVSETLETVGNEITSMDLLYIANIFKKLERKPTIERASKAFNNVVKIVNILSSQPIEIFQESAYSNQTNVLSFSVESLLDKQISYELFDDQGIHITRESNFQIYTINPFIADVSGLIIFKNGCKTHRALKRSMLRNEFKGLDEEGLDFAFYYPDDLLKFSKPKQNFRIVLKIYESKNFFQIKDGYNLKVEDRIYSLSIPGYERSFGNLRLPMLFHSKHSKISCNFWNYDKGSWDSQGVTNATKYNNDLFYCETNHLTSFTKVISLDSKDDQGLWLHFITMSCLLVSGVSIIVMFFIAAFSKEWRHKNIFALNVSTVILVQILVFILSNFSIFSKFCETFGFIIQYVVLVEFSWMFFYIWSMWKKFRNLFLQQSRQTKLTCYFLAWILPVIPVIVAFLLKEEKCTENVLNDGICFPSLKIKIFTFLAPMFVVLIANLVFFILLIRIFRSLLNDQEKLNMNVESSRKDVLWNIIFNVFAIGLPWMFGIMHNFKVDSISSFLFVTIVPLQGTIIFVFKVVLGLFSKPKSKHYKKGANFFVDKYWCKGKNLNSQFNEKLTKELQNLSVTFVEFSEQIL
ncbi:hypothetical protein ACFFRR_004659 [Megaselia abdita]